MSYQLSQRLEKRNHTKQRVAYELRMAEPCGGCGDRPVHFQRGGYFYFMCVNQGCRNVGRDYGGKTFVLARRFWDRNN